MSKYLLLSQHHGLLPLAQRLRVEGHTVEHIPWRQRFEKAWGGVIDTALKGEARRDEETLGPVIELAEAGEVTVLLDSGRWAELFGGAKKLFGSTVGESDLPAPLRACGWWTGENLIHPHLLAVSLGAYPGNGGARVEGGAVLLRGYERVVQGAWAERFDELKASGHRGLVQMHLGQALAPLWSEGGWKGLHTHAWLAAQGGRLGDLLERGEGYLPHAYSVVIPVTVPPWPVVGNVSSSPTEIEGPREAFSQAFWHDSTLQGERLMVAGLDGFVAVAHGEAQSLSLARRKAAAVAQAIGLPEKQVRFDTGEEVDGLVAVLEANGYVQ